jgi:hypothetical protein
MAKTNASFSLSKSTKRIMASIIDPAQRRLYKDAMINAESSFISSKSRKFSDPATSQKPNRGPAPE